MRTQRDIVLQQTTRPSKPLMEFDAGAVNPSEVYGFAKVTVAALICATIGASFVRYIPVPIIQVFGAMLTILGIGLCCILSYLVIRSWFKYQERLDIAFDVAVEAYQLNGGKEVSRTVIASEFSADEPLHMLGVALAIHRRVIAGEDTPFSARGMKGTLFLNEGSNSIKLGDVSTVEQGQELGNRLAELGLIIGRGDRKAGTWKPTSEAEVITTLARNWHNIGLKND